MHQAQQQQRLHLEDMQRHTKTPGDAWISHMFYKLEHVQTIP